jgi:hypothetical protein
MKKAKGEVKAEEEDDDVAEKKPLITVWRSFFKVFFFCKDPFPSHERVKFMLRSFKQTLQEAKSRLDLSDRERGKAVFSGFKPGALLITNVLQVFEEGSDDFNVEKFEPTAFHEVTQVRSGLVRKLRKKITPSTEGHEIEVSSHAFLEENLEVIEQLARSGKEFLMSEFEHPRDDVQEMFPRLWAFVVLLFEEGAVCQSKRDMWKRLCTKISECKDVLSESDANDSPERLEDDQETLDKDLLGRVTRAFERVVENFEREIEGNLFEDYEGFVGEWIVLAYNLISVLVPITELQGQLATVRAWVKKLWDRNIGLPMNLLVKDLPFSEVLACRWGLKQLGLAKVPREVNDLLSSRAADPRILSFEPDQLSGTHEETIQLVWAFFCQDLGFSCGGRPGKEVFEKALEKFEDNFEELLEDLSAGEAYLNCPQSASNLWTFSFWITHYVYVRCGYAMRRLQFGSGLGSSLVKACFLLASIEENRQAPDCLAELVQCILMMKPEAVQEVVPHVEKLLEMEENGSLVLEPSLLEERQVLHGRFVFLLALGTFLAVSRRAEGEQ